MTQSSSESLAAPPFAARRGFRSGVSTVWTLLSIPAALCMLGVIVETGNLWLARVELTNALEAAALAGADVWGDTAINLDARMAAADFAATNTVNGDPVLVAANFTAPTGANPNGNASCIGNVVILGDVTGVSPFTFDAGTAPTIERGVRVQATVPVESIIGKLCGNLMGPWDVTTNVTAIYDGNSPRTVRIGTFICP